MDLSEVEATISLQKLLINVIENQFAITKI